MTQFNLGIEEARLITVRRAIEALDNDLVDVSDASQATDVLTSVVDLDKKEKELSKEELKSFITGFVTGLAASQIQPESVLYEPASDWEEEEITEFVGEGPSGGVATGQGTDARYVTQSGVH